jgi:hypothetical protein
LVLGFQGKKKTEGKFTLNYTKLQNYLEVRAPDLIENPVLTLTVKLFS